MFSLELRGKHKHRSQLLKVSPIPTFPREPQCLGSTFPKTEQELPSSSRLQSQDCSTAGAAESQICILHMGLAGTSTHGEPQVSPVPSVQCKEPQASQVSQEQSSMENSILENLFWEEAPVHCPFELELAAQVKGAGEVPHRVHQQEGQAQNHLPGTHQHHHRALYQVAASPATS